MTLSSVVTLEEDELDMQALSAASSYFFTGWRPLANIANVELRHDHPCGTALGVYDELWRRTYRYGEDYRYDMGHTAAVESVQKTNIDACGKRKI